MAQNPSHLVDPRLQAHIHLISGHRFPHLPTLNLEQAYRYLIDAPTIVKQTAPMSWQYVTPPADGTAWLEWIPARPQPNGSTEYRFASDGFVWADPEQTYRNEFGGYTIEWMSHSLGYKPQMEAVASHARTRFHFVGKNPGVNAPPPDPSLWIVHYHSADQNKMMPVNNIGVSQGMRQIVTERRWLEMQGRIDRRDFMLHDREHWPNISVPSGGPGGAQMQQQQQGMYPNNMLQQQHQQQQMMAAAQAAGGGIPRFPQHAPSFSNASNQSGGPPPQKRPRTSGPSGMPGSGAAGDPADPGNEDEENQLFDYFDLFTPRDISYARYIQHHRWMEEVFSSPYSTSSIVPPDLGLGLMGELKGLTDGLLPAPAHDDIRSDVRIDPPPIKDAQDPRSRDGRQEAIEKERERGNRPWEDKPREAKEANAFTNLGREKVEEFNRRVEVFLRDGEAEIERMKREHAEKMAEWRKTKVLMEAEKRLRFAGWEDRGEEDAVAAFRLEVEPTANGHHQQEEEGRQRESVEEVVRDVEKSLGVRVHSYKDATMVQKGGLEREEEDRKEEAEMQGIEAQQQQQKQLPFINDTDDSMNGGMNGVPQQQQPGLPHAQPQAPNTSLPEPEAMQQRVQPNNNAAQAVPPPAQPQSSLLNESAGPFDDITDINAMDDNVGDTSLLDMDVDVDMDTGDIDFVQHDDDEFDDSLAGTPAQQAQAAQAVGSIAGGAAVPPVPVTPADAPVEGQPEQQPDDGTVEGLGGEDEDDLFGEVDTGVEGDQLDLGGIASPPPSSATQQELVSQQSGDAPLEMPVQSEESAIPAMEADASLGVEADVSAAVVASVGDDASALVDEPEIAAASATTPPNEEPAAVAAIEAQAELPPQPPAPVPAEVDTTSAFDAPPAPTAAEPEAGGVPVGDVEVGDVGAGVFDDDTFDDLPAMGGVGDDDDGLIDFGGGMDGLDVDDSAFGEAFHGMGENRTPEGGGGAT